MADFLLFPWDEPFLPALKQRIFQDTGGRYGEALVIVPNRRPWQYFQQLFLEERKASILPKMITSDQLITQWRLDSVGPLQTIGMLDQAYLLFRCIQELGPTEPLLRRFFGQMTMAAFLPWGLRLAKLLEELFLQLLWPRDLAVPEGDVHRYAAALLESLKAIAASWRKALDGSGLTTPGYDAWLAGQHASHIPKEFQPGEHRYIYIAGFSTLNGAQNCLFKSLWSEGATMCFHADGALATGEQTDGACADVAALARRWGAAFDVIAGDSAASAGPSYRFYAAYDGHSQLEQLVEDLESREEGSVAIVLPDATLLGPTLHHLPDKNINISMGYPLERAPLCGLIELIFTAVMRRLPDGRFYWRDLELLLHHPLVGALESRAGESFGAAALPYLDRLLHGEEEAQPGKYVSMALLLDEARTHLPRWCYLLLKLAWERLLRPLASLATPRQLAMVLDGFCAFLGRRALGLPRGSDEEPGAPRAYPLDTEAFCRLSEHVLPALAHNAMANEEFSLETLREMWGALISQERIPFRAYPLLGTQVLGLLETRLLHFDHIYILDASDDILPGHRGQDPLLPDALRGMLGLPHSSGRSRVMAYNLARLCAGAKHVHFYWPQGQTPSAVDQGKKSRSRFVEQLLWRHERSAQRLLNPGVPPLFMAKSRAAIHWGHPGALPATGPLKAKLNQVLKGQISAAKLNTYLRCPAQFAYQHLLKLKVPSALNEGEDPQAIGQCVHDILARLYRPFEGKPLPSESDIKAYWSQAGADVCTQVAEEHKLQWKLPVFSWLYFQQAAPVLIGRYFIGQPLPTTPMALEKDLRATLVLDGESYDCVGRVDRMDARGEKNIVLDYKTGSPRRMDEGIWFRDEFFTSLDCCKYQEDFEERGEELLNLFREQASDIQLPLYALMADAADWAVANAAHIWLREDGPRWESYLWPGELDRQEGLRRCASLVAFLLRHMRLSQQFSVNPDQCKHCPFTRACHLCEEPPSRNLISNCAVG